MPANFVVQKAPCICAVVFILASGGASLIYTLEVGGYFDLPRSFALLAKSLNSDSQPKAILHFVAACNECGLDACNSTNWALHALNAELSSSMTIGIPLSSWTCSKIGHPATLVRSVDTGSIFVVEGSLPKKKRPSMWKNSTIPAKTISDILFVVYTDSLFYETRINYVLETWGSQLLPESLVFIGDTPATVSNRTIRGSNCETHSHWEGACCKYAVAVYAGYQWVQQSGPERAWVYFTDDDAYVAVDNMVQGLRRHGKILGAKDAHHRSVLGIHGCATHDCRGLCAGGGYALSRSALETLVKHPDTMSEQEFVAEQMKQCRRCERWADQALSSIIQKRGIQEVQMSGLYGWFLDERKFKESLRAPYPPLMYHYVREENQMMFLHVLFGPESAVGYFETSGPCAQYGNRTSCAATLNWNDIPWSPMQRRLSIEKHRAWTDRHQILQRTVKEGGLQGPWPWQAIADHVAGSSIAYDGSSQHLPWSGTLDDQFTGSASQTLRGVKK